MRKIRGMIHPGDPVYYDDEGRIFKKAGKRRIYLGQYSLGNENPIKEGAKFCLRWKQRIKNMKEQLKSI